MILRLKVEPIAGELMRFHVSSQREHQGELPYLVDLEGMDCAGVCPCEHWKRKIYPLVETQMKLPREKRKHFGCLHVIMAREFFLQEVLYKMRDMYSPKTPNDVAQGHREDGQK